MTVMLVAGNPAPSQPNCASDHHFEERTGKDNGRIAHIDDPSVCQASPCMHLNKRNETEQNPKQNRSPVWSG